MISNKTTAAIQGSMLSILFFALGLGRIRNSFDRLPVDPGYEFFEDTYTYGISVLLKTEGGYLDIPRRIFAEVVTLFPIRQTGNVGSLIWLLMVSAAAVFVAVMMKRIHPSKILAIACGACVVLVPSASESQIGNQSVVKWFLILIAIFAVSLPEEHQLSDRFTAILVLLSGVSNPMTIIVIAPLALSIVRNRKLLQSQRTKLIVAAFILGFVVQIVAWKSTGVGVQKYGPPVYWFWPGAGAFWMYNFLFPPLTLLLFIGRSFLPESRGIPQPSRFIVDMAISGLILSIVTYLLSGIGDRYFVVPQILATCVTLLYMYQNFKSMNSVIRLVVVTNVALVCLASIKWYEAGWFLSGGPKWSEQVDLARDKCEVDSTLIIKLEQALGTTDLPCSAILSRS